MRHWQATIPTDPPTTVWLENVSDWRRTHYAIEQGDTRRTQVAEPTPEELGIPGTERRDMFVCWSCRHAFPMNMLAGYNRRKLPLCTQCEARVNRVKEGA